MGSTAPRVAWTDYELRTTSLDAPASCVVCTACGYSVPADAVSPFRCPNALPGDDIDHLLSRRLELSGADLAGAFEDDEPNPFLRFRRFFHAWHWGVARGLSDDDYCDIVRHLDDAVAEVDGKGFVVTPMTEESALASSLGREAQVWVKDETRNVSGSHKARHLMGVMIWLRVAERTALPTERTGLEGELAIASCGNAALAAAVVAKAAGRRLRVFVPPDAHPGVVAKLTELGAHLTRCPRIEGESGDPCMHRFHDALREGDLPFGCQGNENGLTIDGGRLSVPA